MIDSEFRAFTPREQALIDRLSAADFQGASHIREQLRGAKARVIDDEGSFEIKVGNQKKADISPRVPVELVGNDEDGSEIHVLLHVVDGIAKEIEIYKDTFTPISRWPVMWRVQVFKE